MKDAKKTKLLVESLKIKIEELENDNKHLWDFLICLRTRNLSLMEENKKFFELQTGLNTDVIGR